MHEHNIIHVTGVKYLSGLKIVNQFSLRGLIKRQIILINPLIQ